VVESRFADVDVAATLAPTGLSKPVTLSTEADDDEDEDAAVVVVFESVSDSDSSESPTVTVNIGVYGTSSDGVGNCDNNGN
jgi:hypothetical protein